MIRRSTFARLSLWSDRRKSRTRQRQYNRHPAPRSPEPAPAVQARHPKVT